jgi:Xaa-Pro aminopeptidase
MPGLRVYRAEVCGELLHHYSIGEEPAGPYEQAVIDLMAATDSHAAPGLVPAILAALDELGLRRGRIACDEPRIARAIAAERPELEVIEGDALLRNIRMVKTPAEIAVMREAARRNHAALAEMLGMIDEGITWQEVERAYATALARRDCRFASFYVGAGPTQRRAAGTWGLSCLARRPALLSTR